MVNRAPIFSTKSQRLVGAPHLRPTGPWPSTHLYLPMPGTNLSWATLKAKVTSKTESKRINIIDGRKCLPLGPRWSDEGYPDFSMTQMNSLADLNKVI
ncbi:unnamed protein product [Protopolystoma xenopodis]|uniref:Uncharacterized protein n=1 Tax=Protopolystoma xenopodis TaxID=117903 RepID=A0A3S5BMM9_9PLAT|nr:unnamed protein product [Protopolystoma xenopodis]